MTIQESNESVERIIEDLREATHDRFTTEPGTQEHLEAIDEELALDRDLDQVINERASMAPRPRAAWTANQERS
jgi:hypothetical protein